MNNNINSTTAPSNSSDPFKMVAVLILSSGILATVLFIASTPMAPSAFLLFRSVGVFFCSSMLITFFIVIKYRLDKINQKNTVEEIRKLLENTSSTPQPPAEKEK